MKQFGGKISKHNIFPADPGYHDMFDHTAGNYKRRKRMRRHAYKAPGGPFGLKASWPMAAAAMNAAAAAAAAGHHHHHHPHSMAGHHRVHDVSSSGHHHLGLYARTHPYNLAHYAQMNSR